MNKDILIIDFCGDIIEKMLEADGFNIIRAYNAEKAILLDSIPNVAGIIVRSSIILNKNILEKAENLKFVGRLGSGMENIDTEFAATKNIACFNSPEGNRDAVGEHAIGMLLCLLNKLIKANSEINKGLWLREENRGIEIKGKTIGIIGFGNMGTSFANKLKGFEVNILAHDKYKENYGNEFVKEVDLKTVFEKSNIISLHIPLNNETQYMVDNSFINRFKNNIVLINTSRGKIVKTNDLVKNMKSGKVIGACLDVLEFEKPTLEGLSNENNSDFSYLKNSENVVLSPHVAGWTIESKEKLAVILAEKIINFHRQQKLINNTSY